MLLKKIYHSAPWILGVFCFLQIDTSEVFAQQIDVKNTGTLITVEAGAVLSINGDYIDNSNNADFGNDPNATTETLDAPIFLSGTLRLTGDIKNNSGIGTSLIYQFENAVHTGEIVLNGTSPQHINGLSAVYFPNLIIENTTGVILDTLISIDNNLTFTAGSLNLNSNNIDLGIHGAIVGENATRKIVGYPGQISTVAYPINPDTTALDYRGIGLGYDSHATPASLGANFSDVRLYRMHGPQVSQYNVADGVHVFRAYKMETSTLSSPGETVNMPTLHFEYHESELNGLAESSLALYVSNDNGATWLKATSTVDEITNRITATDVPILGTISPFSPINIFTLAIENCVVAANIPSAVITSTNGEVINLSTMNICEGNDLAIQVSSNDTGFYEWTTLSGLETTRQIAKNDLTLVEDHVYSVNVRNNRGCENTSTLTVDVKAIPIPNFTISPDPNMNSICFGTELEFEETTLTASDGSAINAWNWDFNGVDNSTSSNPLFTYPAVGEFTPNLTVTSEFGCVSTNVSSNIAIQTLPTVAFDITKDASNITEICEDIEISLINGSSYLDFDGANSSTILSAWNFGDAGTSSAENPTYIYDEHSLSEPGNAYNIALTVTVEQTGCFRILVKPITVDPEPIPIFTPTISGNMITEACTGEDITFANTSSIPDNTAISHFWNFGDGTSSNEVSPEKQFLTEGNYTVLLTTTSDVHGCVESTLPISILINPPPTRGFTMSDQDVCIGESVQFINNSFITTPGTLSYLWDFGDGSTSTALDPSHSYSDARMYTVKLTRTSNKLCSNTVQKNLTVQPDPVANFVFSNTCDGDTVVFNNSSSIQSGTIKSYLWNFGDGSSTSTEKSPKHLFEQYGDYDVTLIATSDSSCVSKPTTVKTISIYQKPSFNLGARIVACADDYTLDPFADSGAFLPMGSTFIWTDSLGNFIGNTSAITVSMSGIYTATIVSPTPESCETVITTPLFLFQPPSLGLNFSACQQTTLDAERNIPLSQRTLAESTTYQWRKGGMPVPISTARTLVVTETDNYSVEITRTVAGQSCSSMDDILVTVVTDPLVLNLETQYTACDGESILLEAGVVADTYSWIDLGTGEVANTATFLTTSATDYRLTVTSGACSTSQETTTVFNPLPNVSFSASATSICVGESVMFTDLSFVNSGFIANVIWDFGDGTTISNQPAPLKSYATAGDYTVMLTVTSNGTCTDTSFPQIITVNPLPIVDFTIVDACAGEMLNIVNNSTPLGATYQWEFGDGTMSTLAVPVKSFDRAGSYDIVLTTMLNGCSTELGQRVTINALPELDLRGAGTCGTSLLLDAENPGATYRWYNPGTGGTLSTSQQYNVTVSGDIGLEITSVLGCFISDEVNVALNTPVVIDLGLDRLVCDLEILDAGFFPGGSYAWSTGETTRTIEVTSSGEYSVTVIDQNDCSANTAVLLDVNETPTIDLGDNIVLCEGEQVTLDPGADPSFSYLWSTDATTPTIVASTSGTYTVTVSNAMCSSDDSIDIIVHPMPTVDFSSNDICAGETVSFNDLSVYSGAGSLRYLWTFGDGTSSALQNPDKLYGIPNTYNVTLRVTSPNGCSHEASKSVNVGYVPQVNFTVSDGCMDDVLIFNNTTSYFGVESLTYQWDFGDGIFSSEIAPEHAYTNSGNYFVNLTVSTPLGCVDSSVKEVIVGANPVLGNWENSISTCNNSIILDAENVGSTYLWSNNSTNQTLEVTQSGNYTVMITGANGCTLTQEVVVQLFDEMVLTLEDEIEGCGVVMLDLGFQAGATYLWSTGAQTRTLAVTETGVYSVEVTSKNLCISRDTTAVIVRPVPVIDLGVDQELCADRVVQLNAFSNLPVTYLWSTGDTSEFIEVDESGSYSVILTTDHGCTYTDEIVLTFDDLPVSTLEENITACDNLLLDAGNRGGSTYNWSTGSTDRTINVTSSGRYSVLVTNGNGCVNEDLTDVIILPSPTLDLGDDLTLCHGQVAILDAGTTAENYLWSDSSMDRFLTVGASATYGVTIRDDAGCDAYDEVEVTVRPTLGLDLGADQFLCTDAEIALIAGVEGETYTWGSADGFSSQEKEVRLTTPGTYWVSVVDNFNCTESDTVVITTTNQTIMANFLIPSVVGVGNEVHFVQLSEPDPESFSWEFGDGGISIEENPTHRYFREGDFEPTLVVSNGVCTDSLTKTITVRNARFEGEFDEQLLPEFIDIINATLYPNPSEGLVRLDLKLTAETEVYVRVYSLEGHVVVEKKVQLEDDLIEFDLSGKPEGMYLVRIIVGDKVSTLKLLKTGGNR